MDRITARSLERVARFGKCSLRNRPGVEVAIVLNGPPFGCSGFGSNVSVWLGPPFIQSRMQFRLRRGSPAAAEARRGNQPEVENPSVPAMIACKYWRRDNVFLFDTNYLKSPGTVPVKTFPKRV